MSVYQGFFVGNHEKMVVKDGCPLDPKPSQAIFNHSPDGFNWGYGGSGPAQLALALLLEHGLEPALAVGFYQSFKFQVVASWEGIKEWTYTSIQIDEWLSRQPLEDRT